MYFFVSNFFKKRIEQTQGMILALSLLSLLFFLFSIATFLTSTAYSAAPPSIITYQGKLFEDGVSVSTEQDMAFLLFDAEAAGNLLYTASGTLGNTGTIAVTPSSGLFSVNLGGAGTNAVTTSIFAEEDELYLEIWIEGEKMTPRKRVTSAGYAINSMYLMGISPSTTATSTYIPYSDANGRFTFIGDPQSSAVGGGTIYINPGLADADETLFGIALGGVEKFRVDEDGDTTIAGALTVSSTSYLTGTTTIVNTTYIQGKILDPYYDSGDDINLPGSPLDIDIEGNYAYVAMGNGGLAIVDMSDPFSPVTTTVFDPAYNVSVITVVGEYVYVGNNGTVFAILDVSNPYEVKELSSVTVQDAIIKEVLVQGAYAYLGGGVSDIYVMDISDPTDPELVATYAGSGTAEDIAIRGRYLYILTTALGLSVIDASDVQNMNSIGVVDFGFAAAARKIFVSGNHVFITRPGNSDISVVSVADPTNPVDLGDYANPGTPEDIVVAGRYLYIADTNAAQSLQIIDLGTDRGDIGAYTIISETDIGGAENIDLAGQYLFFGDTTDDTVGIVHLNGADIAQSSLGTANIERLQVEQTAYFSDSIHIRNSASIGNGGLLINGGLALSANTTTVSVTNTIKFSHTALFETAVTSTDQYAYIFNTRNELAINTSTYLFSVRNGNTPVFSIATNGNVHTTGTYYGEAVAVSTPGTPGDLAERVDIEPGLQVEPGDVMVVDVQDTDRYTKSTQAYATAIAGVVSTNPTITIGSGRTEFTSVLAMVGRVPVKVTDENGPIERGDLLVSATTPGHAMRYNPEQANERGTVAIIGVALEPLEQGSGKIMSLVRSGWANGLQASITELQEQMDLLALSIGEPLAHNPQALHVDINNNGQIVSITNNLDFNGYGLLQVRSIEGVDGRWMIDEYGRFITTVETEGERTALYALQSQQSQYVLSGSGQLEAGAAFISFDSVTQYIIGEQTDFRINVTLTSESHGIYIKEKTQEGFFVQELLNGQSNATFDWVVIVDRPIDVPEEEVAEDVSLPEVIEEESIDDELVEEEAPGEPPGLEQEDVVEDIVEEEVSAPLLNVPVEGDDLVLEEDVVIDLPQEQL